MLYYISLTDIQACAKKFWCGPKAKYLQRDGLLPMDDIEWSFEKGKNQFDLDCHRAASKGLYLNGIPIKSAEDLIKHVNSLVEKKECHEKFLEEFFLNYDQNALDPVRVYMMLCVANDLRQDSFGKGHASYHNERSVKIYLTQFEARMIITSEEYLYPDADGKIKPIPGKTQTHMLVTPKGFQIVGIMTSNALLRDLFTSLIPINKKEFYKAIDTETHRESQKTWNTDALLNKQLNSLYNSNSVKYRDFCFACVRLLKTDLDVFFLELMAQIIQQLLQLEKFNLSSFFAKKPKSDVTFDAKAISDPAAEYLDGPPLARMSNRRDFLSILEPLIAKTAKDKTLYETLRCINLYVKSSHLWNDGLIIFTEFVRAYCNDPKLTLLATELGDPPKNPQVLNGAEEIATNRL